MMSNSLIPIILTLAIIVVLVIMLSVLKSIVPYYYIRLKDKKRLQKLLYYTEIIGGIIVLSMIAGYLYHRSTVTAFVFMLILVISLGFIGWYFIKDYVAGLIVKASANFSINDIITVKDIKGKIIKFGQRSLIVASADGTKIYIPYSSLTGNVKAVKSSSEIKNNYSFKIETPNTNDAEILSDKIRKFLITLPWVNHTSMPEIKVIDINKEKIIFEISLVAFDNDYYLKIEKTLKDFVDNIDIL